MADIDRFDGFKEGSAPSHIVDLLETHFGEWLSHTDLMLAAEWAGIEVNPDAFRKAFSRIVARAADLDIQVRWVVDDHSDAHLELRVSSRSFPVLTPMSNPDAIIDDWL